MTYCGRLTIPILLWFGAQTRKRRSADTRYNGAPAAVSSSIPNSERRRETARDGERQDEEREELLLRLLSTTTSDVSRGLDVNIQGDFFSLSSACKTDR